MFKTRLLSGILLVVIALITVITGGNVLFATLFLISMIGVYELYRVFEIENKAVDDAVQRAKEIIPHLYRLAPQQPAVDVTTIDPNTQPLPFTVPQDPNSQFQVVETMLEVGTSDESFTQFMDRTKPTKK